MMRPSSSGGSSDASTDAAAHSSVPALSHLWLAAAARMALNTPLFALRFMGGTSRLAVVQRAVGGHVLP